MKFDHTADHDESCQDLVIGSGAGGATTAMLLAESGRNVVVLEDGPRVSNASFAGSITDTMGQIYRDAGLTPIFGSPPIAYAEGRCLGGSTVINGALMWRTPEELISRWQHDFAIKDLCIDTLDPHFKTIEDLLSVSPQPEKNANRQSWVLEKGAKELGWDVRETSRAQKNCQNSNRCPTGCPTGAKQSMLVSFIPRAESAGAQIVCDASAQRILTSGGKAVGIEYLDQSQNGQIRQIKADRIFVCCGPMQTPFLLLRSGISESVGKTLGIHLNLKIVAQFNEDIDPANGTIMSTQVNEFSNRGLYIGGSNFDPVYLALTMAPHGTEHVESVMQEWRSSAIFVAQLRASGSGRVRKLPFMDRPVPSYNLNDTDMENVRFSLLRSVELLFQCGARRIFLPVIGSRPILNMEDCVKVCRDLTASKTLDLLSVHAMGTVPLGRALSDFGEVKNISNLYVNDASMLPDATGTNPQMTIMAMAMRNMDRLLNAN